MKLSIFGSFSLIFLSLTTLTHPAEVKAAAAHAIVAETADTIDSLTSIRLLDETPCPLKSCKNPNTCTDCGHNAGKIIYLLCGIDNIFKRFFEIGDEYAGINQRKLNSAEEFYGPYEDFWRTPLQKNLFNPLDKNQSLFLVIREQCPTPETSCVEHALVVEKAYDGYRIYQSDFNKYTLADWLDLELWKKNKSITDKDHEMFKHYGAGKKVTKISELLKFLETHVKTSKSGLFRYYVRKFMMTN